MGRRPRLAGGNILLLGWCENVMFVIAAALANGRLRRESRRTGESIPVDPSALPVRWPYSSGALVLYAAAKIIVEVLIAWARDHVTPTSSLSAAA